MLFLKKKIRLPEQMDGVRIAILDEFLEIVLVFYSHSRIVWISVRPRLPCCFLNKKYGNALQFANVVESSS